MSGQTTSTTSVDALASLTSRTKARKVADANRHTTLHGTFDTGREVYVRGTETGLYAAAYGPGSGLYLAETLHPEIVRTMLANATIETVTDPEKLPTAIRHPNIKKELEDE